MFDLGAGELLLIVFVVLILFGPKKLPELAQSLGRGMREFKRAQREFTEQINQAVSDDHYRKQRGPELQSPDGSVARGGTRRSIAGGERPDATPANGTPAEGAPASGTPATGTSGDATDHGATPPPASPDATSH